MLVLSRKKNQTIKIDGGIEIVILENKGRAVRVGIMAPRDIRVVRGELSLFEVERNRDRPKTEYETILN